MSQPVRILLVDDDEVDRMICRRALARLEPQPVFADAASAEEALRYVQAHEVDGVLLDYRLPDMDGLDLLDRLAERSADERMAVIMLTGAGDLTVAVEAMRRGASDYLAKDADGRFQALVPTIVQRAMRQRELQRARWRAEQELAQHRLELSDLAQRLMVQEKALVRRMAQALHDRLGQTLAAIRLGFDAAVAAQGGQTTPAAARQLRRVDALIDQAVREVRQVLVELRPPLLDEHGLVAALDNELRSRAPGDGEVELRLEPQPAAAGLRWPPDVEYAAFMIAREAIANALRHAHAASIRILLDGSPGALRLEIVDDGDGMMPGSAPSRPGHLGMVGMRERAMAIGAQYAVDSSAGGGTRVCLQWEAGS